MKTLLCFFVCLCLHFAALNAETVTGEVLR